MYEESGCDRDSCVRRMGMTGSSHEGAGVIEVAEWENRCERRLCERRGV